MIRNQRTFDIFMYLLIIFYYFDTLSRKDKAKNLLRSADWGLPLLSCRQDCNWQWQWPKTSQRMYVALALCLLHLTDWLQFNLH